LPCKNYQHLSTTKPGFLHKCSKTPFEKCHPEPSFDLYEKLRKNLLSGFILILWKTIVAHYLALVQQAFFLSHPPPLTVFSLKYSIRKTNNFRSKIHFFFSFLSDLFHSRLQKKPSQKNYYEQKPASPKIILIYHCLIQEQKRNSKKIVPYNATMI